MGALTEAQKDAFSDWMLELLLNPQNQADITAAKPGVTFDTIGTISHLQGQETAYAGKEGIVTSLDQQKQTAVGVANTYLNNWYKGSSEAADALVGHLGKNHKLSKIIRNKRDSFSQNPPPPVP